MEQLHLLDVGDEGHQWRRQKIEECFHGVCTAVPGEANRGELMVPSSRNPLPGNQGTGRERGRGFQICVIDDSIDELSWQSRHRRSPAVYCVDCLQSNSKSAYLWTFSAQNLEIRGDWCKEISAGLAIFVAGCAGDCRTLALTKTMSENILFHPRNASWLLRPHPTSQICARVCTVHGSDCPDSSSLALHHVSESWTLEERDAHPTWAHDLVYM